MDMETLLNSHGLTGDAQAFFERGQELESQNQLELATTAYDRAFGLDSTHEAIITARQTLLDKLAIVEHGILFRYIPAGTFLMGSEDGDPDERPVHPVRLDGYWLSETPITWEKFTEIMDYNPPPDGFPDEDWEKRNPENWVERAKQSVTGWSSGLAERFPVFRAPNVDYKICLQYCETETLHAHDWHAHVPEQEWRRGDGTTTTSEELFGKVARRNPDAKRHYDQKPVVSIDSITSMLVGARITTDTTLFRLPTEAEWEKGARGGLVNKTYSWGDALPDDTTCDFGRFRDFSIKPPKQFPPNGYGLYGMCGGVWEWAHDIYDSTYYQDSPALNPRNSDTESGKEVVLRGGSWADDAEAVTVSFRSSSKYGGSPNIGFRLCRVER